MELPFTTLDVFTTTRYAGNPLAVITIPPGLSPTQAQKQALAREFNLSETVFIHPPGTDPSVRRIDIFITSAEIPFAGHPTIGAAVSLLGDANVQTLVTKAGPIPLTQPSPGVISAAIPQRVHQHARCLTARHLSPADDTVRAAESSAPLFSIVLGMTFALVPLPDLDALGRLVLPTVDMKPADLLDEGWQEGFASRYYYVPQSERQEGSKTVVAIRSRMLEVGFEDPATGSAACALSCFLSLQRDRQNQSPAGAATTVVYEITQGVELGRESNIIVEVTVKDSKIDAVSLAGSAVQVMRGHVTI